MAVQGEPPEVRPGANALFTPLLVSTDGTDTTSPLRWALCATPKPLDENNIVAGACLTDPGVMQLGAGATMPAQIPDDACALFGPDPPPQMPGVPPLRPRDPDVSGGYYQPVRVENDTLSGFGLERISCDLALAGAQISVAFAMQYKANTNPMLNPMTAAIAGAPVELTALPAGQTITFTTNWPDESAESYPVYDIVSQTLVMHREALRVSWFGTDGSFAHEITGRDENDTATSTDNDWTAPMTAGVVHLWTVLRDSRGGVVWAAYDVTVVN